MSTETFEKLTSDDSIPVMSLCFYNLTLTTNKYGVGGLEYEFTQFGEIKPILYLHLAQILETNKSFAKYPYFYVMDDRVVQRHGLTDVYSKILSKENMDRILNCESKDVIQLYKSAPKSQQDTINKIIIKRILDGEDIDLNIVRGISKEGGLDILQAVKDAEDFAKPIEDNDD